MEGAHVGSSHFVFRPTARPKPDPYSFDIGTAGATPLVAQTLLVPLAHAALASHVQITGGTHVPRAPTADYLHGVYVPALRRAGLSAEINCSSGAITVISINTRAVPSAYDSR